MSNKLAQDALDYLNKIRKNPKSAIPKLQEQLKLFKGKELHLPGEIPLLTQEGAAAVQDCIKFLQGQAPLKELKMDKYLSKACADHINDLGPKGLTGHTGSDGSSMDQRIERYGEWGGKIGENISFGCKTGESIILQLIVDDGVLNRGHRVNCFSKEYNLVGVATGPHKQYKDMAVFDFAGEFSPGGDKQSQASSSKDIKGRNNRREPSSSQPTPQKPNVPSARGQKPATQKPSSYGNTTSFDPTPYIKNDLPREEVVEIKQAFDIFDQDGSGSIDPSELRAAFEDLGFKGQNKFIYQVLGELDKDNSGGIDFDEFLVLATAKVSDKDSKDQVKKVFNLYDWNHEGRITWDELKRVAQDLGEDMTDDEIHAMFKKADLDDDGFVTFEDFYNIMTGKVYWD